jgi:hypothetical protein
MPALRHKTMCTLSVGPPTISEWNSLRPWPVQGLKNEILSAARRCRPLILFFFCAPLCVFHARRVSRGACTLCTQIWHFYEYATRRAIYVVYAAFIKICPIARSTLARSLSGSLKSERRPKSHGWLNFISTPPDLLCTIALDANVGMTMHELFGAKHCKNTQEDKNVWFFLK